MVVSEEVLSINSIFLKREVLCVLIFPEQFERLDQMNLLLLNDGQEIDKMELKTSLAGLYQQQKITPTLVAGVLAGERIQEYGTAGIPDFKGRGSKAALYASFITKELLPKLKELIGTKTFSTVAFAGFSLGGLSAVDIALNHADIFDKVGAFSGSFWWRSKDLSRDYNNETDRIMHQIIRSKNGLPKLKFWFQTGTKDELADRNSNGIIDSMDDTVDLIRTLEQKGYSRQQDITYTEIINGRHNLETWAAVMPKFLQWAFGK